MEGKFNAVFERRDDYWIGFVEELPGANTQGRTLEEARENLVEAVKLIIETNQELSRGEFKGAEVHREEIVISL